jgi:hypothetical protein
MKRAFLVVAIVCGVALEAIAGTVILKRKWVEKYKDRAAIEAPFCVDDAHDKPNRAEKDADLHIAGRSRTVGLPMVAEIMNAKSESDAVKKIQGSIKKGCELTIKGAWRLWMEHPPTHNGKQIQNFAIPEGRKGTNPDHVFEIHPVTVVGTIKVGKSLVPINKAYKTKDVSDAFGRYEKLQARVAATASAITIESTQIGFNYVEFNFRARSAPKKLEDGGYVLLADIFDDSDELLVNSLRLIILPDTRPEELLRGVRAGTEVHALGTPRINLNAIYTFAYSEANDGGHRKLPYEIIIAAVYP